MSKPVLFNSHPSTHHRQDGQSYVVEPNLALQNMHLHICL